MPNAVSPADLTRARVADRVRGQLMQTALKEMLDQVGGARKALPHLAALEGAIGRRGASAIAEVPAHWLAKIISQLSSLPLSENDLELQDLLSGLCRALRRQQEASASPAPVTQTEYLSDFHDSARLEVRELTHSAFAEEFPTQAGQPSLDSQAR